MDKKLTFRDWKKKYYPVPADSPKATDTMLAAVQHALRKWEGLRAEVLKEYGLKTTGCGDVRKGNGVFFVDASTCALCIKYYYNDDGDSCVKCPLYKVRDNVPCYVKKRTERASPFEGFLDNKNPLPMIAWLKKAEKYALKVKE